MNTRTKLLLLALFTFINAVSTMAATVKNVKPISNTVYDWNDPSAWEGGAIPMAGDDVQLQTNSGVTMTMRIPAGLTVQCTGLILPGSVNVGLLLENGAVLEMTGSITKTGTSVHDDMITSNGTGVIKFVGTSRNIAPGGDFEGIKDEIPGWNCEIALDAGEIATTYGDGVSTMNFKCGSLTVSSGTFAIGNDNANSNYDYLLVDQGANGQGNILVKTGATLISKAVGRRLTSGGTTTYINDITVEDGAFLTLKVGSTGNLNAETVTMNGTLQMDGTSTIRSVSSTSPNGDGSTGITYGPNAHLIYTNRTSANKALGGEISRAYSGGIPPTIHKITINSTDQTNSDYRILTTLTVGSASYANSVKISGELVLNGKVEIGDTGTEYIELLNGAILTTDATKNNFISITSRTANDQRGFIRYVDNGETLLFPVSMKTPSGTDRFRPFLLTNNGTGQSFAFASMEPDSWAIDGDDPALFPFMENNFTNGDFNAPAPTAITATDMIQDTRWNIESTTNAGDIVMKVGFDITDPSIGAAFFTNTFHGIFHNDLGGTQWDVYEATYTSADAALYGLGTLTGNYSGTFSPFAFGSHNTIPLPVELSSFTARKEERSNVLDWTTEIELNFSHFNIQHSKDGIVFENMAQVEGDGNASTRQRYTYEDREPYDLSYYRLEMVDVDGTIKHSEILLVQRNKVAITIHPNPTKLFINIKNVPEHSVIEILGTDGVVRMSKEISNEEGEGIRLDVSMLPVGLYILKVGAYTQKFLKQ